jgi:APA family basic amino acid/polyamine antiporter
MSFLDKKSFQDIKEASKVSGLSKSLNWFDLILIGLGAIIGVGVFVTTGTIAANYAGPAVNLSFLLAGLVCIFVALTYAELASMLPTSGSIYTYSYVAYGEIFAWLASGSIFMEFNFGISLVSLGWSGYFKGVLENIGITLPETLSKSYASGGLIDLPAFCIVALLAYTCYMGTKDSKKLNTFLVFVKFAVIATFLALSVTKIDFNNWSTFNPFGFSGIVSGASLCFLSYTGFGAIAAAAEECENPKRDLAIGIIGSLVLSTIVYVILSSALTLIAPYNELGNAQPLAYALAKNGSNIGGALVAVGAIFGAAAVLLMMIYGLSRIFYAIGRDGLMPKALAVLHPVHESPHRMIVLIATLGVVIANFASMDTVFQSLCMASILNCMIVSGTAIYFRFKEPNAERPFMCPMIYLVGPIALLACSYLLYDLMFVSGTLTLKPSGVMFLGVFVIMFVLYVAYKPFREAK